MPDTSDAFSSVPALAHFTANGGPDDTAKLLEKQIWDQRVFETQNLSVYDGRVQPLKRTATEDEQNSLQANRAWIEERRRRESTSCRSFNPA